MGNSEWSPTGGNGGSTTYLPLASGDSTGATDAAEIQAALNTFSAAGGGLARFPDAGAYQVNGPLYQPYNVQVEIPAAVTIKAVGSFSSSSDLWQDAPPTTVAAGSDGGAIENIASWSNPSAGTLSVASTTGYPASGQVRVSVKYATTVGADSNGGNIANIASWATPAAGQLAVASTAEAGSSGKVAVQTDAGTAVVAYTGVGTDGSGHPVLTGCTLYNGSGNVSTGGTVTGSSTAIVAYTGKTATTFTGCSLVNAPVGLVNTGNAVSALTKNGRLTGKGILDANNLARHALYLHYVGGYTIGVCCQNSLQDDCVTGDSAAVSSSFGITFTTDFYTNRTSGSAPTGPYAGLHISASCSDCTFYGSEDGQIVGQQYGIQVDGSDCKLICPHAWSPNYDMLVCFYDNGLNNKWMFPIADTPTTNGLLLGASQNYGVYIGTRVFINSIGGVDNTVVAIKNNGSGQPNKFLGWTVAGASAQLRIKQDYQGDKTNSVFIGCDSSQNVVTVAGITSLFTVPSTASSGSNVAAAFQAASSGTVDITSWWSNNLAGKIASVRHDGLFNGTVVGVATKAKAGVPADGDWTTAPPDGTLVIDTTDSKLYVRSGGSWKSVAVA